jgi:hypothetical protein
VDLNPAYVGQLVTFTASVAPATAAFGTPTGVVVFLDNSMPIGTGNLVPSVSVPPQATFQTSTLAVSPPQHIITAMYVGDALFTSSTSSPLGETINPIPTSTTLVSSLNPSPVSQLVTFTATVSPLVATTISLTGTVAFQDNGSPIGSAPLAFNPADGAYEATVTTTTLAAGPPHNITASYSGDTNFVDSFTLVVQVVTSGPASTSGPTGGSTATTVSQLQTATNQPPSNGLLAIALLDPQGTKQPGTIGSNPVPILGGNVLIVTNGLNNPTGAPGGAVGGGGMGSDADVPTFADRSDTVHFFADGFSTLSERIATAQGRAATLADQTRSSGITRIAFFRAVGAEGEGLVKTDTLAPYTHSVGEKALLLALFGGDAGDNPENVVRLLKNKARFDDSPVQATRSEVAAPAIVSTPDERTRQALVAEAGPPQAPPAETYPDGLVKAALVAMGGLLGIQGLRCLAPTARQAIAAHLRRLRHALDS